MSNDALVVLPPGSTQVLYDAVNRLTAERDAAIADRDFLNEKAIYAATALRDMKKWVERVGKVNGLGPQFVSTLLDSIVAEIKNLERTKP